MGFIASIQRLFAPAATAASRAASGGVLINSVRDLEAFIATGGTTAAGVAVSPDKALAVSAVYRAVTLVSGVLATAPLEIKRRGANNTRETEFEHPAAALMGRRPNRWMTPSAFRRMMTAHLMLRGNAYALIVRSGARVLELVPLHPDRVAVEQMEDLSLVYAYTRRDGRRIVLPQRDMMHLMGLTFDGVRGVSPLTYAREAVGFALATAEHGSRFFCNGTAVGAVLKSPKRVGPEGLDFLRASLETYRGSENAHKTLILEEGMEFAPLGMTAADAEFIASRKFSRTDIAMFFGVPPHMLGDDEKSDGSGKNLEERSRAFVSYTLEDYLTTWEDTIARDLLAEDVSLYAKFRRAALVRGDLASRAKWYQSGLQWGYFSPDEVRAEEELNPRPDGKGGEFYPPPNMTKTDTPATGERPAE